MDYGLIALGMAKILGALIFVCVVVLKAKFGKDSKLPKFVYVVSAFFVVSIILSIYFGGQKGTAREKLLLESAKSINRQYSTPAQVDEGLLLNNVVAQGETLQYFMAFTELERASIDKQWFQGVVNAVKGGACNNSDARLVKEGFSLEYHYADKNGDIIEILKISPEACKNL